MNMGNCAERERRVKVASQADGKARLTAAAVAAAAAATMNQSLL